MSKEIMEIIEDCGFTKQGDAYLVLRGELEGFVRTIEKRKCEELAKKIEAMPFGTTGESFAVWIREQA